MLLMLCFELLEIEGKGPNEAKIERVNAVYSVLVVKSSNR
jgi:hypothetical protein